MATRKKITPPPLPEPKIKITTLYGYPVEDYSKEELIRALGLVSETLNRDMLSLERDFDLAIELAQRP